jgi:hypothetical protein
MYRQYHDTNAWIGPLPPRFDAAGVARCNGNRRVDDVVAGAFFGTPDAPPHEGGGDTEFRGAGRSGPRAARVGPPKFLQAALTVLIRERPLSIGAFAASCHIARNTAWCYACQIVEHWPRAHAMARTFLYPPLLDAMAHARDASGSLRALRTHLESFPDGLGGDQDWRMQTDQFAQLRLARMCHQAANLVESEQQL